MIIKILSFDAFVLDITKRFTMVLPMCFNVVVVF